MIRQILGMLCLCWAVTGVGCSSESGDNSATLQGPSTEGKKYLLSAAPENPLDVTPMREAVEDDQDVVVIGRIGGSHDPWVEGLAAFSLVDRSLAACTDIPGDQCPTPWDYCCVTDKLPNATTLVKVVDDQGEVVTTSASELLGVSELQTLVVKGKAHKDDTGNVTILASAVYVDPTNPGQVKRGADDHGHEHDHGEHDAHDHESNAETDAVTEPQDTANQPQGDS